MLRASWEETMRGRMALRGEKEGRDRGRYPSKNPSGGRKGCNIISMSFC